jgi:hypothetical protein
MRYDTSELHRAISELRAENKRLVKQDKHREKIWRKRIAELEAREPLCRCADEVRCDYLKRIAELEADNKILREKLEASDAYWAECEAKLERYEHVDLFARRMMEFAESEHEKHTELMKALRNMPRYRGVDGHLMLYSADVLALLQGEGK